MLRILPVLLCVTTVMSIPHAAAAADSIAPLTKAQAEAIMSSPMRHVRPVDKRIAAALAEGLQRSGTLAELVLALNRSDVIVYIEVAHGMPPTLAGRLLVSERPDGQRYLRIQIMQEQRVPELIALLAHELRHAVEVAESPEVRNEKTLIALYQRIGHSTNGQHTFDTVAARDTGRRVSREIM